jgi:hypothetical protein
LRPDHFQDVRVSGEPLVVIGVQGIAARYRREFPAEVKGIRSSMSATG